MEQNSIIQNTMKECINSREMIKALVLLNNLHIINQKMKKNHKIFKTIRRITNHQISIEKYKRINATKK